MGRLISLLLLSSSLQGCELYAFCGALFGITSMITLMVIALDRYFVITKPLASVGVTSKKKALIILVGVWLYSLAWSLPPFFGWSKWTGIKLFCPHKYWIKDQLKVQKRVELIAHIWGYNRPIWKKRWNTWWNWRSLIKRK